MISALVRVGALSIASAFLFAACGGESDPETSPIFQAPVWEGDEQATYDLLDEGDELYGVCVLETDVNGESTTVRRLCTDSEGEGHRDDGMAVVDSETLRPIESERVLIRTDEETRTTWTGTYDEDSAVLTYEVADLEDPSQIEDEFTTDREFPEPSEPGDEPAVYDDESLFWLVRGIPLEEDWEGAYNNVNLGIARIVVAEVLVEGRETIEVPAGEFETWRIRLRTASITQRMWVDVESPHRLIRANIERATYELRSVD